MTHILVLICGTVICGVGTVYGAVMGWWYVVVSVMLVCGTAKCGIDIWYCYGWWYEVLDCGTYMWSWHAVRISGADTLCLL